MGASTVALQFCKAEMKAGRYKTPGNIFSTTRVRQIVVRKPFSRSLAYILQPSSGIGALLGVASPMASGMSEIGSLQLRGLPRTSQVFAAGLCCRFVLDLANPSKYQANPDVSHPRTRLTLGENLDLRSPTRHR